MKKGYRKKGVVKVKRNFIRLFSIILYGLLFLNPGVSEEIKPYILIEAENTLQQYGSQGQDRKSAASGGEVLGFEFGGQLGHFAEYEIKIKEAIAPVRIDIRYACAISGSLNIPSLEEGFHLLRLTIIKRGLSMTYPEIPIMNVPILDLVGNRTDKNCVGHGRNVALYTGRPSKFFFATHNLGNIFSAVDGGTIKWYPDHVIVSPDVDCGTNLNVNLDKIEISEYVNTDKKPLKADERTRIIEQRQVCVTKDDVVVSIIHLNNITNHAVIHRIEITGDCRKSFDWRNSKGGKKITKRRGDFVIIIDKNVFPEILSDGLSMAIGSSTKPDEIITTPAGTYKISYDIKVPAKSTKQMAFACAIDPDSQTARVNLEATLRQKDPIELNRKEWQDFFEKNVPRFTCSDIGLEELYGFRWFLLRFSTAGGNLGYFKYPVVLEGRQAYQTYCCYSAPFMALDMNWAVDPKKGFGHIANMIHSKYEDGRFPWYTSPRTNRVKIHHQSKTGLSLLPYAAWRHYLIHGNIEMFQEVYQGMKKNIDWWIKNRDEDGNGLFVIDNQLETGMDDLFRWGDENAKMRYDAVDATSYAYANLEAVANIARVLGKEEDAKYYEDYSRKTKKAVNSALWDDKSECWRDRHPDIKELSDMICITTFYPFFAGIGEHKHLGVFREHLMNPDRFWLPYPVPALSKDDKNFNPTAFWEGPSWPAATSHVIEAFATSAKTLDRSLLPDAAELIVRAARNHLKPRADFYERYNPITGIPLSNFRDYMHSWWIDVIIRHVVGFEPREDGRVEVDPLPLNLDFFLLEHVPYRGRDITIVWQSPEKPVRFEEYPPGFTVYIDEKPIHKSLRIDRWVEGE